MKNSINIAEIVRQAAKNKPLAHCKLYKMFHKEMLGLCIRLTGNNHSAEDILQEGFLKAFSKLKQLKTPESFYAWLKRIMIHQCLDYLKGIEHYEEIDNLQISDEDEEEDDDNWYKLISYEEINKEIDLLPNGCRRIFTLYLIENYKHKEIAQMLDISISTTKSQYQYALKLLKTKLKVKML